MIGGAIIGAMSNYPTGVWTANNSILQPLDSNMVAYWKAEDLTDSVGSHTLTNNGGVAFVSGKYNNCWSFDGADDWLDVGTSQDLNFETGDFTISLWENNTNSSNIYESLIASGNTSWESGCVAISRDYSNHQTVGLHCYDIASNGAVQLESNIISFNEWHHIVLTRIGTTLALYVDNVSQSMSISASLVINFVNSNSCHIGNNGYDGANGQYLGLIDEVHIRKGYGMTASEVSALYNNGTGAFYTG